MEMAYHQAILLLLLLVTSCTSSSFAHHDDDDQDDFLKRCPPSPCGSLQIRYPFRLESANASCGSKGLELTCSGNNTLLLSLRPSLPPLAVTHIDYLWARITVHIGSGFGSFSSSCPFQNLSMYDWLTTPVYSLLGVDVLLVNCSRTIPSPGSDLYRFMGPISCLSGSGSGRYPYVVSAYEWARSLPSTCVVTSKKGTVPYGLADLDRLDVDEDDYLDDWPSFVKSFGKLREVTLIWDGSAVGCWDCERTDGCRDCERSGKFCGFSWVRNHTFCYAPNHHHGSDSILIAGASIGALVILVLVSIILLYKRRQSEREKKRWLKVEKFLATYKTTKPTRYTFRGIKRITNRFKHKLGQGGFGSVYKGELPNKIPVAVKMLEKSKGEGKEFINEVATIGRIHHANVVRLLGFCSEGINHALIYEYMPNGSLEKFIFTKEAKRGNLLFTTEKLLEIAIGVAQGIEYLHRGCDQRILHFDIKPHNILLDHNFNPKISDFGLAKLCSRDFSIITMTAARGTVGYIAPEMYSRNFGAVSYKSDVYSFGMLLMEMVSGKRTVDVTIENHSEVYFPEWIYNRLISGEDLQLATDENGKEDVSKKLVIVALWCIQWNPTDRPSMTRVIQLLTGRLESLQIPPMPFFSS